MVTVLSIGKSKLYFRVLLLLYMLLHSLMIFATQSDAKQWVNVNVNGSLFHSERFNYILHSELRFIDQDRAFETVRVSYAPGYEINPHLSFWLGLQWESKNQVSGMHSQTRIWEQFIWNAFTHERLILINRLRLEERFLQQNPETSYRLRNRVTIRFLDKIANKYNPTTWDELFMNMNNPDWVNNKFIDQNRYFLGVDILNGDNFLEVGYLNQYVIGRSQDVMSHMLYISLNFVVE